MKKYKAIAIPVTFTDDKPRFLTVRDRRFKDWIFVTGGCRRKEIANPLRCALRELEEETRGVISLKKGEYTSRPKLKSFKNKKSNWTQKFEKKYGKDVKTYKQISKATGIPVPALKAVVKKGMGAYYSSGSRPNQTAESWGKARMYSYIMGGPTRKVDHHITEKYNVKFKV